MQSLRKFYEEGISAATSADHSVPVACHGRFQPDLIQQNRELPIYWHNQNGHQFEDGLAELLVASTKAYLEQNLVEMSDAIVHLAGVLNRVDYQTGYELLI